MSGKDEEVSLQDEIRAAFASSNSKVEDGEVDNNGVIDALEGKKDDDKGADVPAESAEGSGPAAEAGKDKAGNEKQAEGEATAAADAAADAATDGVKLTDGKAPSSWSPKVREKWAELPEEVRAEIIRREEASVNGVRQLQTEFAPIRQFTESLAPFLQEAAQLGVNPADHVRNVLIAERNLRSPDQNARFEALLGIADQYGIPLRQALNSAAGKEILPPAQAQQQHPQLPPEVMRELQEARQFRESMQTSTIEQQVNAFKADKEFFEDVKESMADMLDAGVANTLEDAYERAIWANPDVRAVLLEREKSGTTAAQQQQRRAAAAGASVKAGGQADIDVDGDDDDSIEATVRKAMVSQSGRV